MERLKERKNFVLDKEGKRVTHLIDGEIYRGRVEQVKDDPYRWIVIWDEEDDG